MGGFLLLFIISFFIFYNKYDLFRFPFESEVWGNAADWTMVIVTIITAVYLIDTFQEQKRATCIQQKSLDAQNHTNKLEYKKYLDSNMPILSLSSIEYSSSINVSETKFLIELIDNYIQDLDIKHNFPDNYKINHSYFIRNVLSTKGFRVEFIIEHELENPIMEIIEYTGNTITLLFKDMFSNRYSQEIIFLGSNNVFLHPPSRL